MNKGTMKKIMAFVIAIIMVIMVMPSTVIAANEEDLDVKTASKGGITLTKKASFVTNEDGEIKTDDSGNPMIKIDFTVDATKMEAETEKVSEGTSDIVLVIDKSGSMAGDKINNAKIAANKYIDDVLKYNGVRVGVILFSIDKSNVPLTTNDVALKRLIKDSKAEGGTFLQGAIKDAQKFLSESKAENKIIIVLSDGMPTYRYEFNKNMDVEDDSTREIKAPLANPTSYDAYYNFGRKKMGDGKTTTEVINKATISQAYLAREAIDGLNIYSVGYDIESGSEAEEVLRTIADNGKYQAASVDGLGVAIDNITKDVEKIINNVKLVDKVPSQMDIIEEKIIAPKGINVSTKDGEIEFSWSGALEKKVYNMSFETILDLNKLDTNDFRDKAYFNTNGTKVEANGIGANSAILSYGNTGESKISLDSPKLELQLPFDNNEEDDIINNSDNIDKDEFDDNKDEDELDDNCDDKKDENDDKINEISQKIKIIKKWENEDVNNYDRPESVTVNIMCDDKVVEKVILSAKEDWTKTIDVDEKHQGEMVYNVVETNVKVGYTPIYEDAYFNEEGVLVFIITNKYEVKQEVIMPSRPLLKPIENILSKPVIKPIIELVEEPIKEPVEEVTKEPVEELIIAPTLEATVEPTETIVEVTDNIEDEVKVEVTEKPYKGPEEVTVEELITMAEDISEPTVINKYHQAPVQVDKNVVEVNDNTPVTSDNSNMLLYCTYMIVSFIGMILLLLRRKNVA